MQGFGGDRTPCAFHFAPQRHRSRPTGRGVPAAARNSGAPEKSGGPASLALPVQLLYTQAVPGVGERSRKSAAASFAPPFGRNHFFAPWAPWQEPAMAQWAQLQPQELFPARLLL